MAHEQEIETLKKQREGQIVEASQMTLKFHDKSMPPIYAAFVELDQSRLVTLQEAMDRFCEAKKEFRNAGDSIPLARLEEASRFYSADSRSTEYLNKVFDPGISGVDIVEDYSLDIVAVSDYRSLDPGDLQFSRGDIIHVTAQDRSGWWEGEVAGRKGLFPSNFLETPADRLKRSQWDVNAVFLCIEDYKMHERPICSAGDMVHVTLVKGQRCWGINLRTGVKISCPLRVLEQRISGTGDRPDDGVLEADWPS
jgi:hypothetical protein